MKRRRFLQAVAAGGVAALVCPGTHRNTAKASSEPQAPLLLSDQGCGQSDPPATTRCPTAPASSTPPDPQGPRTPNCSRTASTGRRDASSGLASNQANESVRVVDCRRSSQSLSATAAALRAFGQCLSSRNSTVFARWCLRSQICLSSISTQTWSQSSTFKFSLLTAPVRMYEG